MSKILTIDDDEKICTLHGRFLKADGQDVLCAPDAEEARYLGASRTLAKPFDRDELIGQKFDLG